MFDAIYTFISTQLLNTSLTDTAILGYNADLALILTHASIILIYIAIISLIIWLFSFFSDLIR